MAFEIRLTAPPQDCTCRWLTAEVTAIGPDDGEITIDEYRRLSTTEGCPVHDPVKPWPTEACKGRGCSARIIWALSRKDVRMPIDVEPVPDGNVLLGWDAAGNVRATVLTKAMTARAFGRTLYVSHFATCPDAAYFRTVKR